MTVDTELRPVTVACRRSPTPKDPHNISCAPDVYVSPLMWDGTDNMVFRPLSEMVGVERHGEAVNVNSLDEVPDSSWFTNRVGVRTVMSNRGTLCSEGACSPALYSSIPTDRPMARGSSTTERPTDPLRASRA